MVVTISINCIVNSVHAINIDSANIISGGNCGSLLKYKGSVVIVYYAQYTKDGVNYPAYCLDKTKTGVSDGLSYTVSVNDAISDVKLWRIIINGYPYKTIEELGCANKEEAFTATKQAIYCYIHGNNPNDYQPIGEAGNRTLNALNKILTDANNCTETQISNQIEIVKDTKEFTVDNKEKEFISKTYSIKANSSIRNYTVNLKGLVNELPEGVKITDINNNSRNEFSQHEKFKILIPIKQLYNENEFEISIATKIESKPVLYGRAPNSSYQDYALTAATYEDATGNITDNYFKNETKVKIVKQDKETQEKIEGVEFNILDVNKNIIYANLKTDINGEIEVKNLLPGKYFIQETKAKDGYLLNNELIEIEVQLNQELTITINNLFEEKPEVEITEEKLETTMVKKLPVTGM